MLKWSRINLFSSSEWTDVRYAPTIVHWRDAVAAVTRSMLRNK
jgi:hypothetical protein